MTITTAELASIRAAAIGDMLGDPGALDEMGPAATIFRLCRELERLDRERGYGRHRRESDGDHRHDRGLYGDRSFRPRGEEHVFGERESGVDYASPRNSGDYAYEARMARRARREYGDYARRADYRDDDRPITRGAR